MGHEASVYCLFPRRCFCQIKADTNTGDQISAQTKASMRRIKAAWFTFCLIWPLLTDILYVLKAKNMGKKITDGELQKHVTTTEIQKTSNAMQSEDDVYAVTAVCAVLLQLSSYFCSHCDYYLQKFKAILFNFDCDPPLRKTKLNDAC